MKRITLVFFLVVMPFMAWAQDQTAAIKQEAQRCAKALLASDYDGVVGYTHKRVVALMGGKEAMIATLKRGTTEMRDQGIEFSGVTVGEPEAPKKIGTWLVSLVPQQIVMKVPGGRLQQDSKLLGISEDDGTSWVFIDVGPVSKEKLAQVFPELDGKLILPEKKKPVFQKDE